MALHGIVEALDGVEDVGPGLFANEPFVRQVDNWSAKWV